MTKREVIRTVLDGRRPPYVPWHFKFTQEARHMLQEHYGPGVDLEKQLGNHLLVLGNDYGFFEPLPNDRFRDVFGVIWDRSADKDIGVVEGCCLPEPTLKNYRFPDPADRRFFADIPQQIRTYGDCYRVFAIGFSLFERAWTLRGMENLMADLFENPQFVTDLLNAIADYNVAQVRKACEYDIDAVYFGDDWGQQHGLILGPALWHQFMAPALGRMYDEVHKHGKKVFIHSCGDVDELFDDLIKLGVNCFNPFQPEVMNVDALLKQYRGRLTFNGGLSTQRTLPYGTVEDVRRESRHLLQLGAEGSYIFAPAHSVESDVPLENMLAFVEEAQKQSRS